MARIYRFMAIKLSINGSHKKSSFSAKSFLHARENPKLETSTFSPQPQDPQPDVLPSTTTSTQSPPLREDIITSSARFSQNVERKSVVFTNPIDAASEQFEPQNGGMQFTKTEFKQPKSILKRKVNNKQIRTFQSNEIIPVQIISAPNAFSQNQQQQPTVMLLGGQRIHQNTATDYNKGNISSPKQVNPVQSITSTSTSQNKQPQHVQQQKYTNNKANSVRYASLNNEGRRVFSVRFGTPGDNRPDQHLDNLSRSSPRFQQLKQSPINNQFNQQPTNQQANFQFRQQLNTETATNKPSNNKQMPLRMISNNKLNQPTNNNNQLNQPLNNNQLNQPTKYNFNQTTNNQFNQLTNNNNVNQPRNNKLNQPLITNSPPLTNNQFNHPKNNNRFINQLPTNSQLFNSASHSNSQLGQNRMKDNAYRQPQQAQTQIPRTQFQAGIGNGMVGTASNYHPSGPELRQFQAPAQFKKESLRGQNSRIKTQQDVMQLNPTDGRQNGLSISFQKLENPRYQFSAPDAPVRNNRQQQPYPVPTTVSPQGMNQQAPMSQLQPSRPMIARPQKRLFEQRNMRPSQRQRVIQRSRGSGQGRGPTPPPFQGQGQSRIQGPQRRVDTRQDMNGFITTMAPMYKHMTTPSTHTQFNNPSSQGRFKPMPQRPMHSNRNQGGLRRPLNNPHKDGTVTRNFQQEHKQQFSNTNAPHPTGDTQGPLTAADRPTHTCKHTAECEYGCCYTDNGEILDVDTYGPRGAKFGQGQGRCTTRSPGLRERCDDLCTCQTGLECYRRYVPDYEQGERMASNPRYHPPEMTYRPARKCLRKAVSLAERSAFWKCYFDSMCSGPLPS